MLTWVSRLMCFQAKLVGELQAKQVDANARADRVEVYFEGEEVVLSGGPAAEAESSSAAQHREFVCIARFLFFFPPASPFANREENCSLVSSSCIASEESFGKQTALLKNCLRHCLSPWTSLQICPTAFISPSLPCPIA